MNENMQYTGTDSLLNACVDVHVCHVCHVYLWMVLNVMCLMLLWRFILNGVQWNAAMYIHIYIYIHTILYPFY